MAESNDLVMTDVMNLSEAEPADSSQPGPDIPALREQLAILVSTGKAKEVWMQKTLKSTTNVMRLMWAQRQLKHS